MQPEKLSLIVKLTDAGSRRNIARELARYVGADDLTIFIFDTDIQVFLPAPGFPQTLPDGRKWKSFLDECKNNGRATALLPYPDFPQPVQVLGMRGPHTSQIAHDGPSGIDLSKSFYPDIVLLDIGLPGMNGYEVCQAMRKDPVLKNAVYVAQTGWGQKEHLERSKAAGFDYHLVKPVDIKALENIISALHIPKV